MSVGRGVTHRGGRVERQGGREGGSIRYMEDCLREQPQGLKFPTPGVVLLSGLHLASAASHGGTSAIRWQTWHQTWGPDCSRWINVTWIKSRNEWPGLLQLGAQPIRELIGPSKKEAFVVWFWGLLLLLIISGTRVDQSWTNWFKSDYLPVSHTFWPLLITCGKIPLWSSESIIRARYYANIAEYFTYPVFLFQIL